MVGEHVAEALIDSGAVVSLVSEAWLQDAGLDNFEPSPGVSALGGYGENNRVELLGSVTLTLRGHRLQLKPCDFQWSPWNLPSPCRLSLV